MAEDDAALREDSGEGRVRDIGNDGIAGTDEARTDNCSLHSTVVQFARNRCKNARTKAFRIWLSGRKNCPSIGLLSPRSLGGRIPPRRTNTNELAMGGTKRRKASDDHMPATFFLPDIMRPVVRSDIADKQTSRLQLDLHRCIRVISLSSLPSFSPSRLTSPNTAPPS